MARTDAVARLEGVGKSYDGTSFAVRDVSLTLFRGEALVLLGSSGSGKSTVLRTINRLIEPTEGKVIVRGSDASQTSAVDLRRSIGYVAQGIALFPFLTVLENLCLPLKARGVPLAERQDRAAESLGWVRLEAGLLQRMPQQLSGGQQQRVGVARALLVGSDFLLMDEPFGALDAVSREALQEEVVRLKEEMGVSIVFVTHDLFEALTVCNRIGVMHEGRLEQLGTPSEIMADPATPFVRELFERPRRKLALLD